MTDKKKPLDLSDMDADPVPEVDGATADNALEVEQDSDAQVDDKLQNPAEQVPDEDTKWMEGLAPEVTRRIQHVREIESRQDKLQKELDEKIEALEVEYEESCKSRYTERSKIVNGEVDVESNMYETAEEATSDEKATKVKGIPYFWLTAMKNNEVLAEKITRRDEKALKYLKDIKYDALELKFDFYFDTNPFFKNSILTRAFKKIEEGAFKKIEEDGTKIDWYSRKFCLTLKKKKSRHGHPKPKDRYKKCDSFFEFFAVDKNGTVSVEPDDDFIRDIPMYKIIPNAASWYTGKAALEEDSDAIESASEEDSDAIESVEEEDEDENTEEDEDEDENTDEDEDEDEDEENAEEEEEDEYEYEEDDDEDDYEDENEGNGNGKPNNKRTRVEGPPARKSR